MTDVDEDEFEDVFVDDTIYIKYMFEGLSSLGEVAEAFDGFAQWIRELESNGHQLVQPVDGGWLHVDPPLPTQTKEVSPA